VLTFTLCNYYFVKLKNFFNEKNQVNVHNIKKDWVSEHIEKGWIMKKGQQEQMNIKP